jgi:hypothetical protein
VHRTRLSPILHACFLSVSLLVGSARAQGGAAQATVFDVPLPGGLRAALAAIGDRTEPDRAQFLVEFIRRTYDTPFGPRGDAREAVLRSLLTQLKTGGPKSDTLPLPLSPRIWIDVVFAGQATPETLVSDILQSRNAALFYYGLLSLDDDTRTWIAGQPDLITGVVSRRPGSFVAVAPGLRVTPAGVRVPGGALAEPAWQALVGRGPKEATDFVRALLASGDGRLAAFFDAMAGLTPPQISLAFNLESSDVGARLESARRLYSVFQHLWTGRPFEQRAFSRPPLDPALLLAELSVIGKGQPAVPGTQSFWNVVFDENPQPRAEPSKADAAFDGGRPADFSWLCERVFKGEPAEQRRRYMMVLFAARRVGSVTRDTARDAIEAVRAIATYPVLIAALERARVTDVAVFAGAARKAKELSTLPADRALNPLAQFQGALALVTRAASRGSLTPAAVSKLVSLLSAIAISERGEYEGRVVSWLGTWIDDEGRASGPIAANAAATTADPDDDVYESAAGPTERAVLRLLAGPTAVEARFIDWEGTRYRLGLARAEAMRMMTALGESPRPYLSSARTTLVIADALAAVGLTREAVLQQAQALAQLAQEDATNGSEESGGDVAGRYRDVLAAVQRAARAGDIRAAARVAPSLRLLADDLLASGLMEAAYAAALGPRDGVSLPAGEAASRHDFGLRPGLDPSTAWHLALPGTDAAQHWRLAGSLLGLDVALADFSLVRLSLRPPLKPMLSDLDRHTFIDTVALVEPSALTDADRDTIVAAIRKGRARLERVRTPDDARAIGEETALSAQRRTLLPWVLAHDPARVAVFLSPSELLWLGLENVPPDALHAWGAPAASRLGCLCLQVIDRRPWESFAGRWNTGMAASAFPDLNLRLAELLSDLHMPAPLLGAVLTSATLDFVNNVTSRDGDDRRGLVEFVQALRADRMEQYLALLTTDGPLVPTGDAPAAKDGGGRR